MKKGDIAKIILYTIAIAGLLSIAMVAPNALQALKLVGFSGRRIANKKYYIQTKLSKLIKDGYIVVRYKKEGKKYLTLSRKGQEALSIYRLRGSFRKPSVWDGKWRVVIFDIKEHKRGRRDQFRRELVSLGFVKLQQSVWVFPYECEEISLLLKTGLGLGRNALYLTVESMENDKELRRHFGVA